MNRALFTSTSCEWETPRALFAALDAEFHFDLDPCATPGNAKCRDFYTIETDGLTQNWGGAEGVLQPSVRKGDRPVGPEVLRGEPERRHRRDAHTGQDGHGMVPRLHLRKGGDPVHQGSPALQRIDKRGSVPQHDSNFQKKER